MERKIIEKVNKFSGNSEIIFVIDTDNLKECIKANSNSPCWEKHNKRKVLDLKNPAHIELKRKVFKAFGLDADKTYKENLKL